MDAKRYECDLLFNHFNLINKRRAKLNLYKIHVILDIYF